MINLFELSANYVDENLQVYMDHQSNEGIECAWHQDGSFVPWRDYLKDMKQLSLTFPKVVFTLYTEGDRPSDCCIRYFRGGKMQKAPVQISFDQFDPQKLKEII